MAIFRIRITLASGQRLSYTGLFQDGFEAAQQAMADYPEASRVFAMFVGRQA